MGIFWSILVLLPYLSPFGKAKELNVSSSPVNADIGTSAGYCPMLTWTLETHLPPDLEVKTTESEGGENTQTFRNPTHANASPDILDNLHSLKKPGALNQQVLMSAKQAQRCRISRWLTKVCLNERLCG